MKPRLFFPTPNFAYCSKSAQSDSLRSGGQRLVSTLFSRRDTSGAAAVARGGESRAALPEVHAYARVGRREKAEKLAAASSVNLLSQAQIFACLGDKDQTFKALDRAATAGPIRVGWMLNGQAFALLRGDPRVTALRRKVGLPELD